MTGQFHLYVTGYAKFYNEATDICNTKKMLPWRELRLPGVTLPVLTNELRSRVNLAVIALNNAINEAIFTVNSQRIDGKVVRFAHVDPVYEGNRFCEERSNWKSGAWFLTSLGSDAGETNFAVTPDEFPDVTSAGQLDHVVLDLSKVNTTTCQDEAEESGSWGDQFKCTFAQQLILGAIINEGMTGQRPEQIDYTNIPSDDPDDNTALTILPPEAIGGTTLPDIPGLNLDKAFHPKTIALRKTADGVHFLWISHF
jgi:hypothetical protein